MLLIGYRTDLLNNFHFSRFHPPNVWENVLLFHQSSLNALCKFEKKIFELLWSQYFHKNTKLLSLFQFSCVLFTRPIWFQVSKKNSSIIFLWQEQTHFYTYTKTFNIVTVYVNIYYVISVNYSLCYLVLYVVVWIKRLLTSNEYKGTTKARYQPSHFKEQWVDLTENLNVPLPPPPHLHITFVRRFVVNLLGTTAASACLYGNFYIFNIQSTSNKSKATCLFHYISPNSGWIFFRFFSLYLQNWKCYLFF